MTATSLLCLCTTRVTRSRSPPPHPCKGHDKTCRTYKYTPCESRFPEPAKVTSRHHAVSTIPNTNKSTPDVKAVSATCCSNATYCVVHAHTLGARLAIQMQYKCDTNASRLKTEVTDTSPARMIRKKSKYVQYKRPREQYIPASHMLGQLERLHTACCHEGQQLPQFKPRPQDPSWLLPNHVNHLRLSRFQGCKR